MANELLINIVNRALGQKGKSTARNNRAYMCPFCSHHKPKLEINFTENKKGLNPWACWICGTKGKTIRSFLKKIKAPQELIIETSSLVKSDVDESYVSSRETLKLPKEFKPLTSVSKSDIEGRHALAYLKKRGITKADILKHNIGYCEYGTYASRIIIPSYNNGGSLNYFVARTYKAESYKYKNPPRSKDTIVFENFINWDSPIVLCEGVFDALAIKRNSIPLLGKTISQSLRQRLAKANVDKIYIALDEDAQKDALKHCEYLMNENKTVYLLNMEGKDPSELGFTEFTNKIHNALPLNYKDLMALKLKL